MILRSPLLFFSVIFGLILYNMEVVMYYSKNNETYNLLLKTPFLFLNNKLYPIMFLSSI